MKTPLTPESRETLTARIRDAYISACERGECDCVTVEQHEKMLALRDGTSLEEQPV